MILGVLGGLVPLFLIQLGEVIYGGVGSGLYGMLIFAIIAVFVAGLMVGRTPEYLGKKIESYEMKMASLVILIPPMVVLVCTALAVVTEAGKATIYNPGAHGFSEVLYAFSSMGNNNGSAFAGLGANNPFYNLTGGLAMPFARYWLAIPTLAIAGSLARKKLVPVSPVKNPVMFVVEVGSVLTTFLFLQALVGYGKAPAGFILAIALWLWFTVVFANFAEAMAEGRGKAQADTLRQGDVIVVEAGDFIPSAGEVIEGIASVDESAITGESAPVIRESGGDRSAVTGGTRVLSDWLVVRITANPGETFLDRMIAMVEGAKRRKTPNEIALNILLAALTIVFLLATVTLLPFSLYSVNAAGQGAPVTVTVLVALLVCLIPTTIGGLLSAIGIAGMDRTNDAPALAQADVAVAMNSGTQAAKEAGNMVDLDFNPTKLIEVVEIGKQLLITRGSLTTFSIANDIAKYFAIIPAAFATTYPALDALNIMRLATPESAILSAVIFNALIIICLIPLALRGVRYRPVGAATLLRDNLLMYGLGGIVVPFIGIKLIDMLLVALRLV